METTFFFYDLETSGLHASRDRIMQFAGQRTDLNLKPIAKPINILIKLTSDILPDPDAVLLTGITPQQTLAKGITEADFLKLFHETITLPNTIFVGYNTVRFDDEFMRYLHYRNFYDPYEWEWQDGRSRWDLLDVVRMTRALRPEGIIWPQDLSGKSTNKLGEITKLNKLAHIDAHDALGDVNATIEVAKLLKDHQPKLFDYLLKMRDKKQIAKVVESDQPFLYTSLKYSSDYEKTTVVKNLTKHPHREAALVYDLRVDPTPFSKLSVKQLAKAWRYNPDSTETRLPVKTLQYNRCPAIAPLSVLDNTSQRRLSINLDTIKANNKLVNELKDWPNKILEALKLMDEVQDDKYKSTIHDVDELLYEGFFNNADRRIIYDVHAARGQELKDLKPVFQDNRLTKLLPIYIARNFPESLNKTQQTEWDSYRLAKLTNGPGISRLDQFNENIKRLLYAEKLSAKDKLTLNELQQYAANITR